MTSILQPHLTPPRPREKLLSRGVQSLEDVELIALLLGTGQPRELAKRLSVEPLSERPLINNPEKVSQLLLARSYPSGTAKPS